jgi:hypothetical protein
VEPPTVATTTPSPVRDRPAKGEYPISSKEYPITKGGRSGSVPVPCSQDEIADADGRREKIRPKDSGGWRRWERRNGNAVEAILRAVTPTHVVLEKRDGQRLRVPIDRLSEPDRAFLRERTR